MQPGTTSPQSYSVKPPSTPRSSNEKPIVVAVMGATGVGKSTFIRYATGQDVVVGHQILSCTDSVQTFRVPNTNIYLFDTPGFDDANLTDSDILQMIAEKLEKLFKDEVHVSGVLYVHPITAKRMQRSMVKNLRLFQELVGKDNLKSCTLVTTMWGLQSREESESRELELREHPASWKPLIINGAGVARFENSKQSALDIVYETARHGGFVPQLTQEYVVEGKPLSETTAGVEVNNAIEQLKKEHEEAITMLKEEMEGKLAAENKTYADMMKQQKEETEATIKRLEESQRRMASVNAISSGNSLLSRNELYSKSDRPVLIIYAKATTELGNIGVTGSLFVQAVKKVIPNKVAFQGAYYNAVTGVLSNLKGGSDTGTQAMLNAAHTAMQDPERKIFLCGYSQGAMIVCKAYNRMDEQARARINGIVLFGNPEIAGSKPPASATGKVFDMILPLDLVRLPIPIITGSHFMYPLFYKQAARFIRNRI